MSFKPQTPEEKKIDRLEEELVRLRDMIDLGLVESQHKDLCNLREELRTLRDENESLRGSLEEWKLDLIHLRDENAKLRLEVDAWRERFQGYEYRPQDDVVALKLHDYEPGEPV